MIALAKRKEDKPNTIATIQLLANGYELIKAYNELVKGAGKPEDIVPEGVIDYIEREERVPDNFERRTITDPSYDCEIHLRRTCGLSRLTIFEGGHEILYNALFEWFERF